MCPAHFLRTARSVPDTFLEHLRKVYADNPDPGLHAAVEWLLHQCKQDAWLKDANDSLAREDQRRKRMAAVQRSMANDKPRPQWYVNGQGQTMVVFPGPVEFTMGSPQGEAGHRDVETLHRQRIARSFAIADKSVTVEQYQKFLKSVTLEEVQKLLKDKSMKPVAVEQYQAFLKDLQPGEHSSSPGCPMIRVTWYAAAAYCNWLSKREGLPEAQWCYETNKEGRYQEGMKPAADFLSRTGYRLPTEAEWEYACRAGAVTSRYYGETEELLPKYGWYGKPPEWSGKLGSLGSPNEVGILKPNDFGLFDMYGNASSWCDDPYHQYSEEKGVAEDTGDTKSVSNKIERVVRGSAYCCFAANLRSACRRKFQPADRIDCAIGFRPARTSH